MLCPRSWKAYADVECHERCVLRIVKTYIEQYPKGSLDINAFYLSRCKNTKVRMFGFLLSLWVIINSVNSMGKTMMAKAGIKEYFTNHSLRATAVSRLGQKGVDDKLIRGVTAWHRSEALHGYKREINEQLLKVSKISSVRPVQWNNNQYGAGP